jgi:hypothetical protein
MDEYDRRQLKAMQHQLAAYDTGQLDLGGLIASLEALQNLLQTIPEIWREQFREQWGVLEQVYSVAIYREQPIGSAENRNFIAPALARMREMLEEAL